MKNRDAGYTLLEIILAVAILSLGLIGIMRPLMASVNALNSVQERLEALGLIEDKIWEFHYLAKEKGLLLEQMGRRELLGFKTVYQYLSEAKPISNEGNLFELKIKLSWTESGYRRNLDQESYVLLSAPEKT